MITAVYIASYRNRRVKENGILRNILQFLMSILLVYCFILKMYTHVV